MIQEDRIYCVGCGHVISKERASRIFRTGYYKCIMHLGLCEACMEDSRSAAALCHEPHPDAYASADVR